MLLLLLTHIVRFPCGGRGCSKRVGAVTVRQDTSALPHASRVLGWAMGQGSITPATHILGPRTLHPAPETCIFCYAKTGEKIFLWPSEHFWPVLSLSPHKYTPWSAHCALQEAQKPRGGTVPSPATRCSLALLSLFPAQQLQAHQGNSVLA